MKKNFKWMFAAILTSGLFITSCDKTDSPVYTPDPQLEPTLIDFENADAGIAPFVIYDEARIAGEVVADATTGSNVAKFTRSGSSGFGFVTYDLTDKLENAVKAKISFDFMIPAEVLGQSAIALGDAAVHNAVTGGFNTSSGQYGYGTNGCIFYLGAYRGKAYGGGNENYFQINGAPAAASQETHPAADIWGNWFHVDIDVNVADKLVNYVMSKGDEVFFAAEDVPFVSDAAETCTQLSIYIGYGGAIYNIDNLNVQKKSYDESIVYADYTVNYVDTEGNPVPEDLKVAQTRRAKVGSEITLLDSDKANFQTADGSMKYIYQSDNSEGATVTAEGTEIKVVFKAEESKRYNYLVNCYIEGGSGSADRLAQFSGDEYEGVKTYLRPSVCFKHTDGAYYTIAPTTYNGYVYTITGDEEKITAGDKDYVVGALYYAKDESIVYFAELEELAKTNISGEVTSWISFNGNLFDRFSQGQGIKLADGGQVWTDALEAGDYTIAIYGRNDKSATLNGPKIGIRNAAGEVTVIDQVVEWTSAQMKWSTFENISVPAGSSIVILWEGDAINVSIDCIKITKYVPAE